MSSVWWDSHTAVTGIAPVAASAAAAQQTCTHRNTPSCRILGILTPWSEGADGVGFLSVRRRSVCLSGCLSVCSSGGADTPLRMLLLIWWQWGDSHPPSAPSPALVWLLPNGDIIRLSSLQVDENVLWRYLLWCHDAFQDQSHTCTYSTSLDPAAGHICQSCKKFRINCDT